MENDINLFLENVFDVVLKQKDLLKPENKKLIIALLYNILQKHNKILSKNMSVKDPSDEEIMKIFFKNIDFSKFNKCNMEEITENIKTVITIWENSKK